MMPQPNNKRRGWRKYFGFMSFAGLAGLGVLAAGAFALLRTPSWYTPPIIAVDARQRVRNSLVDAEQTFTESLRLGQPFVYHLYADDVNQWIAMRGEIYPLLEELTPRELTDPFVVFDAGEITVAGGYKLSGMRVVFSVDVSAAFQDGAMVLKAVGTRCGSARVPIEFGQLGMDQHVEYGAGKLWPGSPKMHGDFVNGLMIEAEGWWKNGGIAYRVTDLTVEPGRISLTVHPLGRQPPSR